jgi:thiol-disulfide isomerase/thioredoxin
MKLRDIQSELKNMGVSYADCFDRDSLTRRLLEARNGETPVTRCEPEAVAQTPVDVDMSSKPRDDASTSPFDREATLNELRSLGIKELRTELANRRIQWRSMLEKEQLVQALLSARESAHHFSPSGALCPGRVVDVNADQLSLELSKPASTPLLLDVYATWCGPCQMMSPQLTAAAEELGDSVRVAKIDSDKYPDWASRLRVGGLPTVIVFDGATGSELERVEGALMKDGLVQLAKKHM